MLEIPQLELVMEMGTLGSMYTTVEGLLVKVLPRAVEASWVLRRSFFFFRSGRANNKCFETETRLDVEKSGRFLVPFQKKSRPQKS